MVNMGNLFDFILFLMAYIYFMTYIKDWRFGTFLVRYTSIEEAYIYYENYKISVMNEDAMLLVYGLVLWFKAFY